MQKKAGRSANNRLHPCVDLLGAGAFSGNHHPTVSRGPELLPASSRAANLSSGCGVSGR